MLKIYPVLCRAGTMDNYAYILQDGATGISAVLDPSEPQPIIQKLNELGFDIGVAPGSTFMLGQSPAEIIDVSAHTQGHILWYFPQDKALFTGDTLFNLCVGGLFEGTAEQMYHALAKIKQLPDDVEFYPGDEYTLGGADFANYVNNGNSNMSEYLRHAAEKLHAGLPVCPVKLGIEKKCNPYLQADSLEQLKKLL